MQNQISNMYLERPAETLVLKGYRHWTMGIATQDLSYWNEAWELFASTLGARQASLAMDALIVFVKTLGLCASCPLKTHAPDCEGMCRDECLVLGLISGLQYGEKQAVELCLSALTCPDRCDEVAFAANQFAMVLKGAGFSLVPIPASTLSEVLGVAVLSTTVH